MKTALRATLRRADLQLVVLLQHQRQVVVAGKQDEAVGLAWKTVAQVHSVAACGVCRPLLLLQAVAHASTQVVQRDAARHAEKGDGGVPEETV